MLLSSIVGELEPAECLELVVDVIASLATLSLAFMTYKTLKKISVQQDMTE